MARLTATSVLLFATLVAVYPTERIYGSWIRAPASCLTLLLLEGEPNKATGVPNSWLRSNRLVLPAADFGVEEKLVAWSKNVEALAALAKVNASIAPLSTPHSGSTLSLRGRDLSFAAFDRSDPPFV